jgi:hypothetical protein
MPPRGMDQKENGLRPWFGLSPSLLGRLPNQVHSLNAYESSRRGIASAHIGRQSRCQLRAEFRTAFVQSPRGVMLFV